jgi:hypothetical protein
MFKSHLQIISLCLLGHCCWASNESVLFALTMKWASYAGSDSFTDELYCMTVDTSTNLYFGGKLGSGAFFDEQVTPTSNLLSDAGFGNGYVAKTTSDGILSWVSTLTYNRGADTSSVIYGLSVDSGTVVACGYHEYSYDTERNFSLAFPWTDAMVSSLDSSDGSLNWTHSLSDMLLSVDDGTQSAYKSVVHDSLGSIYAVGYTTRTNLSSVSTKAGGCDAVVVKYSAAGEVLWVRYLGGANDDEANAVSIGLDGLYVSGTTQSPGSWITRGNSALPSPSNRCGFLSKIDFAGTNVLYTMVLGGSGHDEILSMQSVSNAIFLAGITVSSDFCSANQLNFSGGNGDGFVLKLTDLGSACQTNWFRYVGSNAQDRVQSLAMMDSNRVVVCGSTGSGNWLPETDDLSKLYSGGKDGFIFQLDRQSGAPKWSTYLGGVSNETAYALVASGKSLFVGGRTGSSAWQLFGGGFQDTWSEMRSGLADGETGFVGQWSQEPGVPPIITNDLPFEVVQVHEGERVEFLVLAQSVPSVTYYWFTNGVAVGSSPTNRYVIEAALPSDNNTTYQCIASSGFGSATSRLARLTVIANGLLTVSISPTNAVGIGAAWQVTGGVWRASDSSVALYPNTNNTYTVSFSNLAHLGWITPAAQEVVIVSSQTTTVHVVYGSPLAAAVRTVTSWTNVSLSVTCPPSVTNWTLIEDFPLYVTPTAYGAGVWNGTNRTLTYTGSGAPTLTYTALVSTNGDFAISGAITSLPINMTMSTGTNNVSRGDFLRKIVGTNVWIYMFAPVSPQLWYLNEFLSVGLTPYDYSLSFPGSWNATLRRIRWTDESSGVNLVMSYKVSGMAGSSYNLSGNCNLIDDGLILPIYGDSVVVIPALPEEPPPPPTILSFSFNGTNAWLTFTSKVSQAYMVVTNANLSVTNGWQNCKPIIGLEGITPVEVPVVSPQLFYRVKIE